MKNRLTFEGFLFIERKKVSSYEMNSIQDHPKKKKILQTIYEWMNETEEIEQKTHLIWKRYAKQPNKKKNNLNWFDSIRSFNLSHAIGADFHVVILFLHQWQNFFHFVLFFCTVLARQ